MDRLGKYEIRSTLGRGAMGTVYEGWDPIISRRVAIKTVRLPDSDDSEEREMLGRFKQEAQAAGRLQHANIVGVFDYAETDELAYIVMEFVSGTTLKSIIEAVPRPDTTEAVRLMDGLLNGLAYSHGNGVIHRDIKPANVMVTPDGQVKIADFGIARIESSTMTQAGMIMGTPAYMSPEQFQGVKIDSRTDLYSAGVVLFQLLTGKRPFEGNMATIMHAVLNSPAPRPSEMDANVTPALDAVVARAMAREADDRFPTATAFNQALHAALKAPPGTTPDMPGSLAHGLGDLLGDEATVIRGAPPRAAKPAAPPPAPKTAAPEPKPATEKKSSLPLVLAGVGALVLVGGGGAFWALSGGNPPAQNGQPQTSQIPARPIAANPIPANATPVPSAPPVVVDAAPTPPTPPVVADAAPVRPAQPVVPDAAPVRPPPAVVTDAAPVRPPAPAVPDAAPVQPVQPATPVVADATPPRPVQPVIEPPPARPADPAPVAVAIAPPSAEAIRRAVSLSLRNAPCSFATGDDRQRTPVLQGVAGRGPGESALHDALQEAAPGVAFDWQVTPVDGPYCAVFDLLRPYAKPFASTARALGVTLAGGRNDLVAKELVKPRVALADAPANLQLDYIASDGSVLHMHDAKPGAPYAADATPSFGEPRPGFKGWEIDEPFGTDLIVAITSTAPLFRTGQALPEKLEDYVRELRASLDQAVRGGARVSAFILPIRTAPRR
jgi:tRNA A-37 threonylcarbamoyl transferase component Bud32